MRRKAENKIRKATADLGKSEFYRIDKVRKRAGIIRKVFDKTILDMARLGTIELKGGNTEGMSDSEIDNLIIQGDKLHVRFKFLDADMISKKPALESAAPADSKEFAHLEIVLLEIDPESWEQFENQCKTREGKSPTQKIQEMISDYNKEGGV